MNYPIVNKNATKMRKSLSIVGIVGLIFYIFFLFICILFVFACCLLIFQYTFLMKIFEKIFVKILRLSWRWCALFWFFADVLGIVGIVLLIVSIISGCAKADTCNGASKWKCFLSYLTFGIIYQDHRIKD